jgi:hypothetical protein
LQQTVASREDEIGLCGKGWRSLLEQLQKIPGRPSAEVNLEQKLCRRSPRGLLQAGLVYHETDLLV